MEPALQRRVTLQIPPEADGRTLLDFVTSRFTYHTDDEWVTQISNGRLRLNGQTVESITCLHAGDRLDYFPLPRPEPPVDFSITLLHQDAELWVVNKSGNLPCHPAGCFFNHTLWAWLKSQQPAPTAIHFLSRLDRETSGIVPIVVSPAAVKRYTSWMRQAQKVYLVWVEGNFPLHMTANGWLFADPASEIRKRRAFSVLQPPSWPVERAETDFVRLEQRDGISLVQATLATGRTHQIRATLSSLGYPVVGDKLYGVNPEFYLKFIHGELTDDDRRQLRLPRQALHAWQLRLPDGRCICAPIPKELERDKI
jgi:23S rRNA-/tRNA-specific pseudouridylate synthase